MFVEGLKYLVFTDAATGMIAVAPVVGDIRQTGAWVEKWCYEFNLVGKAASTDKEDAVGGTITKAFVGRNISIKRASPQNHESAGSPEIEVNHNPPGKHRCDSFVVERVRFWCGFRIKRT